MAVVQQSNAQQVKKVIADKIIAQVGDKIILRSVYQIKEDFRPVFKERKLADQMRSKILENTKITPTEVKLYFDKISKDSLPYYETEIEVSQILLIPKSNKDVDEYVSRQLYEYKRQVEAGTKKFDQLAKLYSDDIGTEKQGGTLTLNRNDKGMWDPTFLSAVFKLK